MRDRRLLIGSTLVGALIAVSQIGGVSQGRAFSIVVFTSVSLLILVSSVGLIVGERQRRG